MSKEALDIDFDSLFGQGVEYEVGGSPEEGSTPENVEGNLSPTEETKDKVEFIVGEPPELEGEEKEKAEEKEVSVQEDEKETPSFDDIDGKKDASGSFALAFAKFQQDEGVISEFDEEELVKIVEEEGETGAMKYLLELSKDKIYEEAKEVYGGDKEELLEYFRLKDAGVDGEVAKELVFQKSNLDKLSKEGLEGEDKEALRREILAQHLKLTTRFTDKKIRETVEDWISLGKDEAEAAEALEDLKIINKQQLEAAEAQVKEQEKAKIEAVNKYKTELKDYIYGLTEIIEGQKINKPTQQKMEKLLLEPVKDVHGNVTNGLWAERAKDPKKFDTHLSYLLTSGLFYGKTDVIKKTTKTKVLNEFEEALKTKGSGVKGTPTGGNKADEFDMNAFFRGKV